MNPDQPLQLLGGLTAREFLRDYWQQKPLLIRQAIPDFQSPLEPDELAGLSLEEEIESRLIIGQDRTWELRRGPLPEDTFAGLPERDWTLLVQSVDQFVPEVAEVLEAFRFLPSWRVDDVMISYAAPGGGVGPHYDHYDVFLLQGHGCRRWRIGQPCTADSPLIDGLELKILADFQQTDEWVLEPGDMLYLPPGLAHDGIAEDECMTYSIGFRAPSAGEVLTHFTDFLNQFIPEDERYSDAGCAPASEHPAEIPPEAIERLRGLMERHLSDDRLLLAWFGQHMTEPRYPERVAGENLSAKQLRKELDEGALLMRNPSGRIAWSRLEDEVMVFASGQSRLLPMRLQPLLDLLCSADVLHEANLAPWLQDDDAMRLIRELLQQGSLIFAGEDDDE
ncbi:cupin domain-containing protein [uncultured Pseudomonas sp.]|uniref:ribosomal protein uL16 3-hydroxylase n=1 Tax=uncultured Pseudomonas sp. TaxID=114707 RepID=UPI00258BC158|nr:cupin domain-containing protein [uncultured Pseudomonas sp.]